MAISGFRMLGSGQPMSSRFPAVPTSSTGRNCLPGLLFLLAFLLILPGCMPTIRYGSPPRVEQLNTLNDGVSGKSDVLLALGEPRGYGVAHISRTLPARDIWFYEYTEAEGGEIGIKYLLVFFDKEIYDGYLWFSSVNQVSRSF